MVRRGKIRMSPGEVPTLWLASGVRPSAMVPAHGTPENVSREWTVPVDMSNETYTLFDGEEPDSGVDMRLRTRTRAPMGIMIRHLIMAEDVQYEITLCDIDYLNLQSPTARACSSDR
ncbi:uncharacterized protein J7T54_000995 [Emericellopsis cladophorae]|uniref:Uncharacterized protein n=1 Tax=Emericellopsis cladophorae TaxID=2686198 RepID=A0A9P9XXI8_9HYPO|nr:uncharacterized protein J7T54_000995 [Emericellopsis cladophorae]KAI6779265.1 hypothetical protein J7T54_000995 [Emericellopsis cladophorae]